MKREGLTKRKPCDEGGRLVMIPVSQGMLPVDGHHGSYERG